MGTYNGIYHVFSKQLVLHEVIKSLNFFTPVREEINFSENLTA